MVDLTVLTNEGLAIQLEDPSVSVVASFRLYLLETARRLRFYGDALQNTQLERDAELRQLAETAADKMVKLQNENDTLHKKCDAAVAEAAQLRIIIESSQKSNNFNARQMAQRRMEIDAATWAMVLVKEAIEARYGVYLKNVKAADERAQALAVEVHNLSKTSHRIECEELEAEIRALLAEGAQLDDLVCEIHPDGTRKIVRRSN